MKGGTARGRPGALPLLPRLLAHILWPDHCPVCRRIGVPACEACLVGLLRDTPVCCLCGRPWPCSCNARSLPLHSGAEHQGLPRELVHRLKYGGRRSLARPMGRALAQVLPRPRTPACLVPVPLHATGKRRFNQSALIARGLADTWGLPVRHPLRWTDTRPPQVGRTGPERRELPPEAMTADTTPGTAEACIIVDDVATTRATLRAAAGALWRARRDVAAAVTWTRSGTPSEGGTSDG
ncbi:MAG: ComF family protein [Synergistales bacterium]|nr:ComF family protein [Synergistales bacterium]